MVGIVGGVGVVGVVGFVGVVGTVGAVEAVERAEAVVVVMFGVVVTLAISTVANLNLGFSGNHLPVHSAAETKRKNKKNELERR